MMNSQSRAAVASNNPRVQKALCDYFDRVDRSEAFDREVFLAQYSDVADELRSLIAFDEEARRLAKQESPQASPSALVAATVLPVPNKAEVSTHSVVGGVDGTVSGKPKPTISPPEITSVGKPSDELPPVFGRYHVKKKLGSGAMGAVYLAEDSLLQRDVALKTPTFENDTDGELLKRFYREARAVSKLKHNNLCGVYDVGEIDGRHYISMEFVPGKKLQEFIKPDKPMTEKQAMAVVRKIALAMQEAHSHGVIHRDLKPDNIMVNEKGEPVVMDFGLVHKTESKDSTKLTQHGTLIGSPAYMSKEQVEGDPDKLTGATDQYSLGVILYQLLTSKLPFEGGIHAVLGAILTKEPPPPREYRPDINPHLEVVCLRMMAKEASNRYPSMKAAADALAEVAKGTSTAAGTLQPSTPIGSPHSGEVPDFNFEFLNQSPLTGAATRNHPSPRTSAQKTTKLARLSEFWHSLPPWQRFTSAAAAAAFVALLGVVIVINTRTGKTKIKTDGSPAVVKLTKQGNKTTIEVDRGQDKTAGSKDNTELPITSPTAGESTAPSIDTGNDPDRVAAMWLLSLPRTHETPPVYVKMPGEIGELGISRADELPSGRLELTWLNLAFLKQMTSKQLAEHIEPLTHLRSLRIPGSVISADVIDTISRKKSLSSLELMNAGERFGDDEMARLAGLHALGNLNISDSHLTDAGLKHVVQHRSLRQLWLIRTRVTDVGLSELQSLPNLAELYLSETAISDEGVRNLRGVRGLERLSLLKTRVTDESLADIGEMRWLESLYLADTAVSDKGLPHLTRLANLRTLDLERTKVTPAGVEILRRALPDLMTIKTKTAEAKEAENGPASVASSARPSNGTNSTLKQKPSAESPPLAKAPFSTAEAKQHQQAWADFLGLPIEFENSIGMKFRLIPPGEFLMGAGLPNQRLQHSVRITKPFYLGVYEVTREEYAHITDSKAKLPSLAARIPEGAVSRTAAFEYCRQLTAFPDEKLQSRTYRLPTEAEWEFACRGGSDGKWSFGDAPQQLGDYGWYLDNAARQILPVGQKRPNGFELFDMHGNVSEWVSDWFAELSVTPPGDDPTGPATGTKGVIRGSDSQFAAEYLMSAARQKYDLDSRHTHIGLRVLCEVPTRLPATERQIAEMVIGKGGAVSVNRDVAKIDQIAKLPSGEFKITMVDFGFQQRVTNEDLDRLRAVNALETLIIRDASLITATGIETLRGIPTLDDVVLFNANVTDQCGEHFAQLKKLKRLSVSASQVGDNFVRNLAASSAIKELELRARTVNGQEFADFPPMQLHKLDIAMNVDKHGLEVVSKLRGLTSLDVQGNVNVDDEGMAAIAKLQALHSLLLHRTSITDRGLAEVGRCLNLKTLWIQDTRITDAGLKHLIRLEKLESLNLGNTSITDEGAAIIGSLTNINTVWLSGTKVTNNGLKQLLGLPKLTSLWLSDLPQIDDQGLEHLKQLRALKTLGVSNTSVTPDGIKRLKIALPNCQVFQ